MKKGMDTLVKGHFSINPKYIIIEDNILITIHTYEIGGNYMYDFCYCSYHKMYIFFNNTSFYGFFYK
jgi:hypothetical protein